MDYVIVKSLKKDLADAIKKQDIERVKEIRNILAISNEQAKYFDKGLTGYPSIDKPWLKYYAEGAEERANNIPNGKTVWDVIEEKLLEYYDYPALEYFKREFSRQEFIDLCYTWARTFRAMGVDEDEVVPVYGPFVPDICAMVFGLNMIGACPYFLKLAIDKKSLEEETRDAKIAVVYDGMWQNVAEEFSKDKFKNIIVATSPDYMPSPTKQIVTFKNIMDSVKNKSRIPKEEKYIWADKARELANYYSGNVKVSFKENRPTFITSSSGTTVGGIVKGTVATNESTISQLLMGKESGIQYFPGDRCLNHFPPTASTSLNVLFLLALYCGETVLIDPRVSEKDFYNQIVFLKPNMALNTSSLWEAFFNRVKKEMQQGKTFDFSYAKGWTIGGEGTDQKKYVEWNEIMIACNAYNLLFSGYGNSELFSAVSVEKTNARMDFSKPVMSVGIPYAGITVGVYDEFGDELSYNQRGELRVKSKSAMKGYYNKPDLTEKTIVDGYILTGDIAEIDENGFLYIWGRLKDLIQLEDGSGIYAFDISNRLKQNEFIDDAIILAMPTETNENNLVAHIVWKEEYSLKEKKTFIEIMNEQLESYLPEKISVSAYSEHDTMLPYSPTTLKKDRNLMSTQRKGFVQVIDGKLYNIKNQLSDNGKFIQTKRRFIKDKVKMLTR